MISKVIKKLYPFCALLIIVIPAGCLTASSQQVVYSSYLPISLNPACTSYAASTTMTPSKVTVSAGETFTVEVRLQNTGCIRLGRPIYQINMQSPQQSMPLTVASGTNDLSMPPGGLDVIELPVTLPDAGDVTLTAVVSFEVHFDSGPPLWGRSESQPVAIIVAP